MRFKFALATAAAVFAAQAPAAELLINGGLNSTATHPLSGTPSLQPGSTAIEGWSIFGNSDVAMVGTAFNTAPQEGNYYAELMGYTDTPGRYAGLSQTIATVQGASYLLSFYLGRYPGDGSTIGVQASAGATSQIFTATALAAPGAWTRYTMNFVAGAASTPVSIVGNQGTFHIGLDAISVTGLAGGVPEPASWAMMLGGFALLGRTARLRRKRHTQVFA